MKEKRTRTFSKLALAEVQQIYVMRGQRQSIREIAACVRRSTSTVHRVIRKYCHPSNAVWRGMSALERAKYAQDKLKMKRRTGGNHGRLRSRVVREYVLSKLIEEHWSPEEIAGRILIDIPGQSIAPQTIYNFIKYERSDLSRFLMERGKPRRQRVAHRRGRFRQGAPTKRSIHERPEFIGNRDEVGHWEGDLIISKRGSSQAILSVTERATRKKIFRLIPNTQADTVHAALWAVIESIPNHMRKTLTLDNGAEFAYSRLIELERRYDGFKLYYCDPYAAWQKGSVENSNRDARWYIPKGTDFANVSRESVMEVEERLGRRPLKCLNYRTPDECFLVQSIAA